MRLPFDGDWPLTEPFGTPDNGRGWWLDGYHTGIDYALPTGTPVLAMASGRVLMASEFGGKGLTVAVEHERYISRYCHLSTIAVQWGQEVAEGDYLGESGATGFVTGPHLHWEVLRDGLYIDPLSLVGAQRPVPSDDALALVDGLWHIADQLNAQANELRRLVIALKAHYSL